MSKIKAAAIVLSFSVLTSCVPGPDSPKGFSLPPGDKVSGEQVFLIYQCLAYHSLSGQENSNLIYTQTTSRYSTSA